MKGRMSTVNLGVFICIGIFVCSCGETKEGNLKSRYQEYMAAWNKQDIHEVAKLMAPLASGKRDFEKEYSNVLEREGPAPKVGSYVLQEISVDGNKGRVVADWTALDPSSGKTLGTVRQGCDAVYIDGLWYFNGCKPVGGSTR